MPLLRIANSRHASRTRRQGISRFAALGVALACAAATVSVEPAHAAPPVGLGTAGGFAVLAGSGITNTGATTVTGDVGTFPTPTETGFGTVTLNGVNHAGDAVTQQAKTDLVAGYGTAAGSGPTAAVATELGGTTLTPGVYGSPTLAITGTLTLDAQGDPSAVFIFKASSTLITASSSTVVGLNGLDPCNVFWQVGSSATLGTNSSLIGSILASTSITATNGATVQGRLLALDGAVTLDRNTIVRPTCVPPTTVTTTTSVVAAPIVLTPATTPVALTTTPPTTPPTTLPTVAPTTTGATGLVSATTTSAPAGSTTTTTPVTAAATSSPDATVTTLPVAPAFPPEQTPGETPSLSFTGTDPLLGVLAWLAVLAIAAGAILVRFVRTRSNT